ncbi:MAG: tetratricopeptide repeat protein [Woeseiaceae bacterium]
MKVHSYKAFISYSHKDAAWAKWIHRALESYRLPAKLAAEHGVESNRLRPVFRDRDELSTSSSLSDVIEAALAASESLIVICSPSAAKSKWVNEEIKTFKAMGRGDRIFCLIVDGDDGTFFPPALAEDEPLGVDPRPNADGKQDAKLKIISGLLGIGFAELKDREQRRRARFFAASAAASLLIAGIMTALAISAVLSGREAERNRALAAQSLKEAEAVSGFLSTMLAEVDPEAMGNTIVEDFLAQGGVDLLPPGINATNTARLVLDQHLLNKASDAVKTQFAEQPAVSARLDESIGASYHAIGLFDKAIERHTRSLGLYREQFGEDDRRTLRASASLAQSLLYEGRLDDSAAEYESALATSREMYGVENAETLAIMNGLAMTYTDMDRFPEARALLDEAVPLTATTFGDEHSNTLDVRNNLGWVLYAMGEYEAAENVIVPNLKVQRRVQGEEAPQTLSALNNLALIYRRTDRLAEAEAAHREELMISQRVLGDDHPEVLISMLNLGRVLLSAEKLADADEVLSDALEKSRRVLPAVHPLLAAITTATGEVAMADGRLDMARELFLETRGIYEQMFEPGHPRFKGIDDLLGQLQP